MAQSPICYFADMVASPLLVGALSVLAFTHFARPTLVEWCLLVVIGASLWTSNRTGVDWPMRNFLHAGKLLLLDMASTILFLVVFLLTNNVPLSVGLGIALGLAQISWQFLRKKPIEAMEWLSLFLVVASGTATLITNDLRFVMFKPSLIYTVVGIVMLKPGWINRYLPALAKAVVPDIAVIVGFLWAGLMFLSAAVNVFVALNYSLITWASFMPVFGIVSKAVLFLIGFAAMRYIGRRRWQEMPESERDTLTAAAGQ